MRKEQNKLLALSNVHLNDARVIIREDLNVPLDKNRQITNDTRIQRAVPTIKTALQHNARVIILSHLGRPKEGKYDETFSLAPVAKSLSEQLNQPVKLVKNWLNGVNVGTGEVVLCENVRFNVGEKACDKQLSQKMAQLCDIFVMDAFATAHRSQASTVGIAQYAPVACAGPLLNAEIKALNHALHNPKRPLIAIVGGSKVSSKIHILEHLLDKVDQLIVGGGIANTFIKAMGHSVGKSLCENDWLDRAKQFFELAKTKNVDIPLPLDVVVANTLSPQAKTNLKPIDQVEPNESIFDIGPQSCESYAKFIATAGTILWNGPVGVFEYAAFSQGTSAIAQAVSESSAFSVAGGGDTIAAIEKFNVNDRISYISTGGGAFLEFVEGKTLPAIEILTKRATTHE